MRDLFRVHAVKWSMKQSGNIVTPIDKYDFMNNDIYDILSLKPIRAKRKMASEGEPNELKVASDEVASSSHLYAVGERASLISQPVFFKFVDNMVHGLINNYITIIKKHTKHFEIKELKNLQKTYNLSDFFITKIGNYIFAYNLKLTQFPRLVKILRKAKSENLSYFLTRRHLPMQISDSVYKDGEIYNNIESLGTLKSKYGLEHDHSRPHCNLFNVRYENMLGNENNRVGTMRVS